MIVRATATAATATAWLVPSSLQALPLPGPPRRKPALPEAGEFGETRWVDLDDEADAADIGHEADAADAALLRCVGCAAFATLVLALVSSLQMA